MSAYTEYLASTASAQAQMDFQERMSNTAHVREVADLKAAGLNPVLSAGGSGASTPSGAEGDYSAILPMLLSTVNNTAKALGKGIKNLSESTLINAVTNNNESTNSGEDNFLKKDYTVHDLDEDLVSTVEAFPGMKWIRPLHEAITHWAEAMYRNKEWKKILKQGQTPFSATQTYKNQHLKRVRNRRYGKGNKNTNSARSNSQYVAMMNNNYSSKYDY